MKITLTILTLLLSAFSGNAMAAQIEEAGEIRSIIKKVNGYWQTNHNAENIPFWHVAAYHTGNMEAYFLTGEPSYLDYSLRWAEHNEWAGAKEKDKSLWKYTYGENDRHVLFGDFQICFQTYADLYNILPDDRRIARAREVMEYEMSLPQNDFWWWADALYMVMPVMTKMYLITGNQLYLDKLYEYLRYTDSIMYDEETGLYFRDGKYVYPKHKTASGSKDFWARGDGWVLAGLAKVLKDMPKSYGHYDFFVQKYTKLAEAVAQCQQKQGYWTRSMLDPDQAPGPETSGTAFFAYGIMWGINNGLLPAEQYLPVADKAWNYLRGTALQKDGSVGYVQPIGERAIPGQQVSASSQADFGVGAFLLAACERVRFLEGCGKAPEKKGKKTASIPDGVRDREYWVNLAYQMATPVLSNMAEGKLQANMLVETSPTWDGRNIKVTYLECFGRLMTGIAPWLALPDDDTAEGAKRRQLREWALKSYANAVDPDSPDYLLWEGEGQALVDAAFLAESFIRAYDALWMPLDNVTKQRYFECFKKLRVVDPPYTNWLLFSSTLESFMARAGSDFDMYRISSAIRKVEEWYVGDGWYADGTNFAFDYYSSYVFHPMYLETLQNMMEYRPGSYRMNYIKEFNRAQKFSIILERFISPEGTFPVFGRSIPYRMAAMQPLALLAWYRQLPSGLLPGQVRAALTSVMHSMYDGKENFNEKGYLTIGFAGRQPGIADWYTNNGSLYLTSVAFLPLGLPASDPFWTDASLPWTSCKAWGGEAFPKDHVWSDLSARRTLF